MTINNLKPSSQKKLQEWVNNAIRKGLDPNDIALYISAETTGTLPAPPEPETPEPETTA